MSLNKKQKKKIEQMRRFLRGRRKIMDAGDEPGHLTFSLAGFKRRFHFVFNPYFWRRRGWPVLKRTKNSTWYVGWFLVTGFYRTQVKDGD